MERGGQGESFFSPEQPSSAKTLTTKNAETQNKFGRRVFDPPRIIPIDNANSQLSFRPREKSFSSFLGCAMRTARHSRDHLIMKLVIFGLTISSSWGNGHATLWRGLCAGLAQRKHHVVFFERDVPYYAMHRDLAQIPGGALFLYLDWSSARVEAQRQLADADVAIVTSYCPDGIAASEIVFDSRALKVFYDLDTPVTLEHLENGASLDYIGPRGLRDFELVLSYTGGEAVRELRCRLGARQVAPLYGSVDPRMHHRVTPVDRYGADFSYIGTYAEDRQDKLEALFLEPARRMPRRRFLIAGAMYPPSFSWSENLFFVHHISPPDHPGLYSSSRLTLNLTRRAMARMGYCPSGRLFEAAACGTPILSDCWDGLEEFFEPGREILLAHDGEDTVRALEMADGELERIAVRARERALTEHSAGARAQQLEDILSNAARRQQFSATAIGLARLSPEN
jgi:spore maturation protein CgeB